MTQSPCHEMPAHAYYPLFADLRTRPCVVVGGGMVAQRKVMMLLRCGARVTVISPTLTRRLAAHARAGRIRAVLRTFRPSDLRGAWLVYAATNQAGINTRVFRAASARRIFTNVVDQKPLCSFIAPAIFQRGPLTIAVSTGGASPTLAKRLRRELGRTIGTEYVPMLRLLAELRDVAKRTLPSYRDRMRYFDRVVSGRAFELVRAGRYRQAKTAAVALLERAAARNGA